MTVVVLVTVTGVGVIVVVVVVVVVCVVVTVPQPAEARQKIRPIQPKYLRPVFNFSLGISFIVGQPYYSTIIPEIKIDRKTTNLISEYINIIHVYLHYGINIIYGKQ